MPYAVDSVGADMNDVTGAVRRRPPGLTNGLPYEAR